MALKKTVNLPNNFGQTTQIVDAYIKVSSVLFTKSSSMATIEYKEQKDSAPIYVESENFVSNVEDGSENAIKQAYVFLKTLPRFIGAIDC